MKFPFQPSPQYTAICLAYSNRQMIADEVLPRVTVTAREFKWDEHAKSSMFQVPSTLVGRKGSPNEVEFTAEERTSSVKDYGLDDVVPLEDIEAAQGKPGLDPLGRATEGVTQLIMLDREIRTAAKVFAAATYPVGNKVQLAGNDQWSAYAQAASDPVEDILTAKESALMPYNTAVIGEATWFKLRRHPKVLAAYYPVNASGNGIMTLQQFAELFEFERVLIGRAYKATTKPGQTLALSQVWGKHFAMMHQNPLAGLRGNGITFGATAEYGTRFAGTLDEPKVGLRGATRVRVGEMVDELITAADVGYFIEDAVA
ncbi:MAG: phage capsid protein [Steroidobacteraceae bacterium]